MGPRYVLSVAAVAVGLAVSFAIGGFFLPPGNAAIPTALAFAATGVLGGAVRAHSNIRRNASVISNVGCPMRVIGPLNQSGGERRDRNGGGACGLLRSVARNLDPLGSHGKHDLEQLWYSTRSLTAAAADERR